ncbi:unannotated protein [freshwater metagenome]|uniref:Unannotated protein n=1 Tax=freshwater metagenome TaxID=449393 RepID=A0A6J7IGS5_9ZZZZ
MLGNGQELDVREAGGADVLRELDCELTIGEPLPPGAEMHLVDAHGPPVGVVRGTVREPCVVLPAMSRREDDRAVRGWDLGRERVRVGLLAPGTVTSEDLELVGGAIADAGDEQLPDAGRAQGAHRVGGAVPEVEVAGDANSLRVRCPDGERDAADRTERGRVLAHVRAEHLPELLVAALADEMEIDLAEGGEESVGVVGGDDAAGISDIDRVVRNLGGLDDPAPNAAVFVAQRDPRIGSHDGDAVGKGTQDADGDGAAAGVRTEDLVRLVMGAVDDATEIEHRYGEGVAHRCSSIRDRVLLATGHMDDVGDLLEGT